jgi:hypothetical protein
VTEDRVLLAFAVIISALCIVIGAIWALGRQQEAGK